MKIYKKYLSKTPTSTRKYPYFVHHESPTLSIGDIDALLCEKVRIYEEVAEGEISLPSTDTMVGNRKPEMSPIRETNGEAKMKNIDAYSLPHLYGLANEYPDTCIFEFVISCKTYDYTKY